MTMTMNEYQQAALKTARFPGSEEGYFNYPMTKLAGEVGEFLEKIGKFMRHNDVLTVNVHMLSEDQRRDLALELGDIKWYAAILSDQLGYPDEEIGQMNIDKLTSRSERGVINGSGDHR